MITAVIATYWKEREWNIPKIVDALNTGTVKVDQIIFFNNNPHVQVWSSKAIDIRSSHNFGHRAKFISAMLYPSDWYFFLDDDMCPNKKTIERFMEYADDEYCLTQFGRRLNVHERFRSAEIDTPKIVDFAEGVGSIFCSFNALVRMVELEAELRKHQIVYEREADIVLSMANKTKVVPTDSDSTLIDIGQNGVGMFQEYGHTNKRNNLIKEIVRVRGGEIK